ncbi:MAG: tryptophan synthase subunit alpha [Armatimonadota bacterium]|nr:tryptophan synthase subunit alpha [Armatimonadota bacterium]
MNRIAQTFDRLRASGRRALMPFVMGGDPALEATEAFLVGCAEAGADLLEIGVPFSDPIADGPINQRAALRALRAGTTLAGVLDLAARVRPRVTQPIVLLSYYNPILRMGLEAFTRRASSAGVDGVVIPDLPPEEGHALATVADPAGLAVIFLAAPTSTDARLAQVAAASRGFVYCVSLTGVTGVRSRLAADVGGLVRRLRAHTALPVCVGFGVSTPEHAREIVAVADGVIVGSAIVAIIERDGAGAGPALREFVTALRRGIDARDAADADAS